MLLKISRFFVYASLAAVLFVNKSLFFPFITGKQIFFRACVELSLGFFLAYLVCVFLDKKLQRREIAWQALKKHLTHPVVISLFVLAAALFVAVLTSPGPTAALWSNYERGDGAFQILHYILFAFLIKVLFTEQKHLHRLLATHIVMSIPVCFYAFGQMFSEPGSMTFVAASDRVSGTLGNPSYLAAYLIFSLAFITYFFLRSKDIFLRAGLALLAVAQIFLMIKAQTLGAALGVLVGLLVFALYLIWDTESEKVKNIGLIIGAVVAGIVLLFLGTKHLSFWHDIPLFNRITNVSDAVKNVRPRFWTWDSALSGVAERPITGWGAENFPVPFDKYYVPLHYGTESFFDRTHDIFLEYMIDGGILALLPWLLSFFFYYRALLKRKPSIWKSVAVAVPVMYFVQGVFLFDVLPIYIPLYVFMMFIINTNSEKNDEAGTLPESLDYSPLAYGAHAVLAAGIGAVLYTTAYAPLHRNQLIVQALTSGNQMMIESSTKTVDQLTKKPADVFKEFHESIDYPFPIGRGEAIEMYQKFAIDLLSGVSRIPNVEKNEAARRDIFAIMSDVNKTFDTYPNLIPGVKDRYVNATANIRVGLMFGMPNFVARGQEMLEQDLAKNPKRIELVIGMLELAQGKKDVALFNKWYVVANQLRPDLYPSQPSR